MVDAQIVLSLIRAALDDVPVAVQEDFSTEEYLSFARTQQIEAILIAGLHKSGISISDEMRKVYIQAVWMSDRQMAAAQTICAALASAEIDHMPLKGSLLKKLYPSEELRSMGDIDVLIRMEQYDRIREVMSEAGYREILEREHEFVWNRDGIQVELHKCLIPAYNEDYYAYFGEGWQYARPIGTTCRYEMNTEDTFVYLFTHYAKHYRDAGVGIRQALDLYIYRRTYPQMREDYVREKMVLLQLERFYANTMHMLEVWFGTEEHTEASQMISDRLFASGVFGTRESSLYSGMLKQVNHQGSMKKAKLLNRLERAFLPYSRMCKIYPCLQRHPLLLPLMWVVRWGNALLHKRDRFLMYIREDGMVTDDAVAAYQEMLRKSGLDFNFK